MSKASAVSGQRKNIWNSFWLLSILYFRTKKNDTANQMFSFNQWNVAGIVFVGQHYVLKKQKKMLFYFLYVLWRLGLLKYIGVYIPANECHKRLQRCDSCFLSKKEIRLQGGTKTIEFIITLSILSTVFPPPVMICYVFFFCIFYSAVCLERYSSTRLLTLSRGGETTNHSNTNEKNKRHSRHFYCCI